MENFCKLLLNGYILDKINYILDKNKYYIKTIQKRRVVLSFEILEETIHSVTIKKIYINENRLDVVKKTIDILAVNFVKIINYYIAQNCYFTIYIDNDDIALEFIEDDDGLTIKCCMENIFLTNYQEE